MTAQVARLGDPTLHFWLTRSVARAAYVNLSEAMTNGCLNVQEYSALVTRCRKCQHVETCEAWLASNAASATRAPDHCPNADILNRLAADLKA